VRWSGGPPPGRSAADGALELTGCAPHGPRPTLTLPGPANR